jgi:hypothetical protein
VPLYIVSQAAAILRGSLPTSSGRSSCSTTATIADAAPALPTAGRDSP